jgi:hypothetical protein
MLFLQKQKELSNQQLLAAALIVKKLSSNKPDIFAAKHLKVLNKDKVLVPFLWNKAQYDFHYKRTGRDLLLKARQLGFSTYMQGELFRRTIKQTRTTITLAHDADTTQKLRLMADRFWENYYVNNEREPRKYANSSMTSYPRHDSVASIATAGSLHTGRGDTYTDFHGSEVAFWPDAEKIVNGALQGGNPDAVLESTPNGAQGYFYELCMEALRNNSIWHLHFYPWWWDLSYSIPLHDDERIDFTDEEKELTERHHLSAAQIKWRRYKQKELKGSFIQEYPEDPITCFLTSGKSYFGNLSHCFNAPMNTVYDPSHKYFGGLDFGQSNDFTVMIVLDKTAKRMVDIMRINKLEWKEQRKRIVQMHNKWHLSNCGAEINSIGSVNYEALADEKIKVTPFETNNESKAYIMSSLYEALHPELPINQWQLQDDPSLHHEMNTFVSTQLPSGVWRLAADGEGHDDTVMALAIALYTAMTSMQIF